MSFKEFRFGKMPTHWESKRIIDYTEIVTDYVANGSFASLKENVTYFEDPNYAVLIRLTDYNRGFDGQFVYIDEHAYNFLSKTQLFGGEIIISNVGANVGTVFKVPYLRKKMNLGPNSIMVKTKGNDDFYFYWFSSPNGQESIKSILSGSAQPKFNKTSFRNLELPIPPYKEQKVIAHILSTLDDKIEVNNQINKTLENIAQVIFKQWFVDFEFPNEDGEPYKSSGGEMIASELGMIPKGWEVISLDKIVDVKSGYSYKGTDLSESNNAMVTIKNFDRNGGYKKDGLKEIIISDRVKKHHYIEINDVVVAHTDLTQGAEIIGNPVMVLSKGKYEKLIMSMDVVKVISKDNDIDNAFIYCLLKTDNFKQYALGYVNGTTVLHLSKKAIPQYKLPFPTDIKICKELSAILKTIMMKISLSDNENDNLNLTRDILLPKLMSGEIRVPLDEEGDVS